MLIQESVGPELLENIRGGQAMCLTLAAATFLRMENPERLVRWVHRELSFSIDDSPADTQKSFVRLLMIVGFGAVVRHAEEHQLDQEFFTKG